MNQVDYKKKYNEALERMKSWARGEHPECFTEARKAAEFIFPELAENEDEVIKQEIIKLVRFFYGSSLVCKHLVSEDKMIAWLEKQVEQKPIYKVEPKFKVGDWVVNNDNLWHVDSVDKTHYRVSDINGEYFIPISKQDELQFYISSEAKRGGRDLQQELEKQKEQKPVSITDEWIEDYWQHEKVNNPYSYDKGEEIQFDHQGFVGFCKKYCKKPTDEEMKTSEMQKPADKIEPKFNVGDWIFYSGDHYEGVRYITKIDECGYYIERNGSPNGIIPFNHSVRMRPWTIQDAKDGDVLVNGSNIFIFHFINGTRLMGYCHVNTDDGRFYDDIGKNECFCLIDAVVNPATKEQRNLLFSKMKEAGYEWDAVKKELKKIKIDQKLVELQEERKAAEFEKVFKTKFGI